MITFKKFLAEAADDNGVSFKRALGYELIRAAQKKYDEWDEKKLLSEGHCIAIADAMMAVIKHHGIEARTEFDVGSEHTWIFVLLKDGTYVVDIPWGIYERLPTNKYQKIPNVKFNPRNHLKVYRVGGRDMFKDTAIEYEYVNGHTVKPLSGDQED